MIVRVREAAYRDIFEIENWVRQQSPGSASRIVDRILDELDRLKQFPFLGHAGRVRDTREWIVALRYRVSD